MDLDFDVSPFFQFLPTFWENFEDRPLLETIYSSYLRLADADYAGLFTNDDNKDLSSLRPTRFQPLAYQEFNNWENQAVKHGHKRFILDWPTERLGKYSVRLKDVVLGDKNLIFVDKYLIPSFLYTVKEDWWIEANSVVRGCLLSIDADKLGRYFSSETTDSTLCFTSDPNSAGEYQKLSILTFNHKDVLTFRASEDTPNYFFDDAYDLEQADVNIEFRDITRFVTVTYTDGLASLTIPPGVAPSTKGLIELNDGTLITSVLISSFSVVTGSKTIRKVSAHINFNLRAEVAVDSTGVTLAGAAFSAGTDVIVRTPNGTVVSPVIQSTSRVSASCDNPQLAQVSYLGTNLTQFSVGRSPENEASCGGELERPQAIRFSGVLESGTTFRVTAAKAEGHTHNYEVFDAPTTANALIKTAVSFDPNTLMVFRNGELLYPNTDYSLKADSGIRLSTVVPGKVVVWYETASRTPHTHKAFKVVQDLSNTVTTIDLDSTVLGDPLLFQGSLLQVAGIDLESSEKTIGLASAITPRRVYSGFYATESRQYKHLIPYIEEPDWDYQGRLLSAEKLSDGIEQSTIDLTSSDFDLVREGSRLYVYTDVKLDSGWWHNVQIDDHALQRIWGDLINLPGESNEVYARVLGAILTAARASSSARNIENFISIALGSAHLQSDGFLRGVLSTDQTTVARIQPVQGDLYTIPVLPCAPIVDTSGQCLPKFTAINQLAQVRPLDVIENAWQLLALEQLSDSFEAAQRLDFSTTTEFTSIPFTYDTGTNVLTDFSVDFEAAGITFGSLIKADIGYYQDPPPGAPAIAFGQVTRRIDKHTVVVDLPIDPPQLSGYSENTYSEGPFGGVLSPGNFISKYTAWGRVKERLDTFYTLDQFPDSALNGLNDIANAFTFGVRLDWSAMTNSDAIAAIQTLLDIVKPADTGYFVFTEAFTDLCSAPLVDSLQYAISDSEVSLELIPNVFSVGNSFFLNESVILNSGANRYLFGNNFTAGISLEAAVSSIPTDAAVGDYYILKAPHSHISLYMTERALGDALIQVTEKGDKGPAFEVRSNLGSRPAKGIVLAENSVTVNTQSSTNVIQPSRRAFGFNEADEFTANVWITTRPGDHMDGDEIDILTWGDISVRLTAGSADNYTPSARTYDTTLTAPQFVDGTHLISLVYRASASFDGFDQLLYIDSILAASTIASNDDDFKLPSFSDPLILGNASTRTFNGVLLLFDLRSAAMSLAEIQAVYNSGIGVYPTIGKDLQGNPISYPDAWITYCFHTQDGLVVPDYSGNAFGAELAKTVEFGSGTLQTTMAQPDDVHIITKYVEQNGIRVPVPKFSALNPTINDNRFNTVFTPSGEVVGGSAAFNDNSRTLNRDGTSYFLPDTVFVKLNTGEWVQQNTGELVASATVSSDNTDLYTGFTV